MTGGKPWKRRTPCALASALRLLLLAPWLSVSIGAEGQPVSGSVTTGWAWRTNSGSLDAFKTQMNLGTGFFVEALDLRVAGGPSEHDTLTLTGWGFGGAEPAEAAKLRYTPNRCWRVDLGYDRRFSAFELSESGLGLGSDSWNLLRIKGGVTYEGLDPVRISVTGRLHDRSGDAIRPFFGLNSIYPLAVTLDQKYTEAALKLESKDLGPWYLSLEQALGWSVKKDRWAPGGPGSIQYPLTGAESSREDKRFVPTTRATATYRSERFEAAGAFLWSRASLDANPQASVTFDFDQGRIGRAQTIDQTVGSATADSLAGSLRLGVDLGSGWAVRVLGEGRDSSTDATLLGQLLMKLTSPTGQENVIPGPVDEASTFDVRYLLGRLQVEKAFAGLTLWVGGDLEERSVSWRETREEPTVEIERKANGLLMGFALDLGRPFRLDGEYEHGAFSQYVFRTEPEKVDRFTGRLRATIAKGLVASLTGKWEKGTNPPEIASLDRKSAAYGLSIDYGTESWGAGASANILDFRNEIGIVLPGSLPVRSTSLYDTSVVTLSLFGRVKVGGVTLEARGTRVEDRGETWPIDAWNASGRLSYRFTAPFELGAFLQYWSYDEELADRDDFKVTRYGLLARWDF